MNLKKKSTLTNALTIDQAKLTDPESYRARALPATGYYIKDEDSTTPQLNLFE